MATRSRPKRAQVQTFGKGDVRGVIASESSNNAKEGGALVPTVAFGVPGSATMAILLGAFLIHGLVPGPDMLTKNLSITYAMVWSVALANILGAGLCYAFSPQFAKLATLRYTLILPAVLGIIYIGAFEASRQWGDLFTLLFFGLVGWTMKQFKWPRPPLILGVVLGDTIERYMFISIERYGLTWMLRPVVVLLFALAIMGLVRPLLQDVRSQGGLKQMLTSFQRPTFHPSQLFTMFMVVLVGSATSMALRWDFSAKIVPLVVGTVALCAATLSLFNEMCRKPAAARVEGLAERAEHEVGEKIHMDLTSDTGHLPVREIIHARRAVLRLSHRLHGGDGRHRTYSHGGAVRRLLHALRGARALVAGDPLCRRFGLLHLVRLRLLHGRSLATHADGRVVPGAEGDPLGVNPPRNDAFPALIPRRRLTAR